MRVGLLEVVTKDLGELGQLIGEVVLEPFGEPFVQARPIFASHALIRSKPNQRVTEAESVSAGALDQALTLQRIEMALDERTRVVRKQRTHRVLPQVHGDNGGEAEHVALAGSQTVQSHRQQPSEGAWDQVGGVVVE